MTGSIECLPDRQYSLARCELTRTSTGEKRKKMHGIRSSKKAYFITQLDMWVQDMSNPIYSGQLRCQLLS